MYVILLGPPGAGKGTQAVQTAERTGLLHLSTGDMFRENLRNGTDLGNLAKTYMDRGELVPDDVTIRMLLERISREDAQSGCLFDGFPRTVAQARALDEALADSRQEIAVTVLIDVSNEEITRRLGGRISCATCGSVFHEVFNPPDADNPCCDQINMVQRDDDKPEAIANRLQVYADQTEPLVAYYREAGILAKVNGEQSPEAVGAELLAALQHAGAGA